MALRLPMWATARDRPYKLRRYGDDDPAWRPSEFGYDIFGCRVSLTCPTVKLLDYAPRWEELATDRNPFAVIVMAHLKTLATRGDASERLHWKLNLIRGLYDGGYSKTDILELFRVIDWLCRRWPPPQSTPATTWRDSRRCCATRPPLARRRNSSRS
ncbi:MAG: hypothetical protein FJ011_10225 [Chloroflexi bacterium]|nr:hypothetical protein [Chloroflexota bacterium]